MKKILANSDEGNTEDGFLPSDKLWLTVQMARKKEVEIPLITASSGAPEMLGLIISILRRRKHISRQRFAQKLGCSVEEILALEGGLLPAKDIARYLPLIIKKIKVPKKILQPYLKEIDFT